MTNYCLNSEVVFILVCMDMLLNSSSSFISYSVYEIIYMSQLMQEWICSKMVLWVIWGCYESCEGRRWEEVVHICMNERGCIYPLLICSSSIICMCFSDSGNSIWHKNNLEYFWWRLKSLMDSLNFSSVAGVLSGIHDIHISAKIFLIKLKFH